MGHDERSSPSPTTRPIAGAGPLSLTELSERAGVTVRTVRYYIAEGLLPPPVSAGPQSHYTPGHVDRLRLIARLKDAYLPLREIRRRLAGLDDAAVRELLNRDDVARQEPPSAARDYLDQVLGAPPSRAGPSRPPAPAPRQPSLQEARLEMGGGYIAEDEPPPPRPLTIGVATPLLSAAPLADTEAERAEPAAWRRVRLTEDAELLIRESVYQRRQDRIEWLIRWARRVFR
ncbi:MAG: MerR family transcriptional regulator [Chloroflexota bacterium]|nr:MerR family transcriptional regulator [Chloroflexota bacterium]